MVNENQSTNPLQSYFRHPEVYVTLPSKGRFMPEGNIEMTPNGEVGVCAMTASDEILLKSPDALLNGDAVTKMIKSCVPGIKDVLKVPSPDIDVLLLAIRKATYGDEMDVEVECPKCKHENMFGISLEYIFSLVQYLEDEYPVKLSNNMTVYLKPRDYESNIKEAMRSFHETQILRMVIDEDIGEDEKMKQYNETILKISNFLIEINANSIDRIFSPENEEIIATHEQISEWFKNISKKDADKILDKLNEINSVGSQYKVTVECQNPDVDGKKTKCDHEWEADIKFDPSHFFE